METKNLAENLPETKIENEEIEDENKLDPRQSLCWGYYIDQKSGTFSNAYRSALKAGYGNGAASVITNRVWWKDKRRRSRLLSKSEHITDKIFDMEAVDKDGNIKADILRVQADTAKHIQKTLGKDEGYSERTETIGNGSNVVFLPAELIEKFNLGTKVATNEEQKDAI